MNKEALTAPALEALLQAPTLAILAVDKQGCVIMWSPSASRMFGWTESEVLGRFLPIVPEEQRQGVYDRIQRELKGENISALDVRRLRKDGSVLDVSLWTTPLRASTGEVIGILGVHADITARKQWEEALQQTRAELQEVLAAVSDYIWSGQFDPDGRFSYRYNSPAVERILGRPAEFFLAGPGQWLSTVHPEDRPRVVQALDRLQTGQSTSGDEEYRVVLPDGAIRWVRDRVASSRSADGCRCLNGVVTDITARKQAEEALRESEARFRGIFTAAASGIVLVSPEGRFLQANPAFCKFLGYSEQELLSKSVQDVTHPDDRERTAEIRRGVWEGGKTLTRSYEKRYLRKDGQTVWVEVSFSLIRDATGKANYSIAQVLDITERKRAEMALQESEQRFRALIEHGFDVIAVVKTDGTIQFTSVSTARVLGYQPHELVGRNAFDLVHPEDLPRATDAFHRLLQTPGGTMVEQFRCCHKDGSWRWVETSGTNCLAQPAMGGVILNYRDITDQKRAEEMLQERVRKSERHLAAIVESSDDAIISTDLHARVTSWNAAAQRLFIYAPEEILGRSALVLVPPNRKGEGRENLKRVQRGEHMTHFETVRLRKGGVPVEVSITLSPVRDDAGQIIGVSAIYHDITERKQAEEALQKSEEQYRALVETTQTGYVILDRAGRVLDANAEYVRLTGHRDLGEIRGRSVVEWTAGADKERNAEAVRTCLKTGYIRNLEIGYVDSHGKVTPVLINATVEKARGALRIVSLCRDITERKELEQAIVEASAREQRRIGLDMHDSLCQRLTGVGFLWQELAQGVAAGILPKAAEVAEFSQLVTKTIVEARDLARTLCPVELEHSDLGVALKDLGLSIKRLFGISCVVRCQQPVPLADKAVATHLYRIAQEAISNASHHGKAARVWIQLGWRKNKLTLRIRDNGSGFSKRRGFKEGVGMRSMKYRAQVIGGSLTIESERGAGTTVACVCTLPRSGVAGEADLSP